jgi:hypothetical protein
VGVVGVVEGVEGDKVAGARSAGEDAVEDNKDTSLLNLEGDRVTRWDSREDGVGGVDVRCIDILVPLVLVVLISGSECATDGIEDATDDMLSSVSDRLVLFLSLDKMSLCELRAEIDMFDIVDRFDWWGGVVDIGSNSAVMVPFFVSVATPARAL